MTTMLPNNPVLPEPEQRDPREVSNSLVEYVHDGDVLATHRLLRSLTIEDLRSVTHYLAACADPDRALIPSTRRRVTDGEVVERVVERVARAFQQKPENVIHSRTRDHSASRHVVMAVALRLGLTATSVARELGRDHTTVLYGRDKVAADEVLDAFAARVADRVTDSVLT